MNLTSIETRYLFFTGKGGVGKTSISCATAIALADKGRRVLLVSTDPASNLDEVLGVKLGSAPTAVPGVGGLFALNLDPELAASEYREKMVGPYRGVLPEATVRSMEEQLSGSCTMEIAAFDEFSRLLGDPARTAGFDHVIFDTAPTGHTLRLLSLPHAWSSFIETSTTGTSCLGPLAGLKDQQNLYLASVEALANSERTTLILVSRPEVSALREAARSSAELRELGVSNQCLVLNGVFRAMRQDDPVAVAFERRGRDALAAMPAGIRELPRQEIRLSPRALLGADALRTMFDDAPHPAAPPPSSSRPQELPSPLVRLVDEMEAAGRGVIMTMGKGGVGKTTVAAAIALELARRGHPVRLSTTDPAAHVSWLIDDPPAGLEVGRIDAERETQAYRDEVMGAVGGNLDAQGKALLTEDLRSPCTEEVAVFRTFARTVAEGKDGFVVLDTAPTGHTILLLDAAEAYHREVLRQSSDMPETVRELLPRLRDPGFTRILLVTLPEATPVHEAARLQSDLGRAEIHPFAWVINQALTPVETTDPILVSRQSNEQGYIAEVVDKLAKRAALVPWMSEPPTGGASLRAFVEGRESTSAKSADRLGG
ncbi:MAG: arsenical pump-driving ATPase [Proteobacteria bacterium]|jgi:arsenite-transporting ATPase|nr:arsenical pump-driving ATPase [Pseudomonadota bacterium]